MTYGLHNLSRPKGAQRSKRRGRGNASGHGTYSGRGQKGQRARTGGSQGIRRRAMKQLVSHLPKMRGFRSLRPQAEAVNLVDLNRFPANTVVTPDMMRLAGFCQSSAVVKILGTGEIDRALIVQAHGFSVSARNGITKAGGKAVVLPVRKARPMPHRHVKPTVQ
jgi:large subunit ribosomal protein L15